MEEESKVDSAVDKVQECL